MNNIEDITSYVSELAFGAQTAKHQLVEAKTAVKNEVLNIIAHELSNHRLQLLEANRVDCEQGEKKGLSSALLDRLQITQTSIDKMIDGLHQIVALPDPIGTIDNLSYRPSGIQVGTMRVPLGVIAIIYESRPEVTVDAAALCLKSGNAVILRGGSEAIRSNTVIADCIHRSLKKAGLSEKAVSLIKTTDRRAISAMLARHDCIDLVIPRGGKELIRLVSEQARMPVLKHLDGICHVYVDKYASLDKAISIAMNSKTQRYGTCNTMETLLVDVTIAKVFFQRIVSLYQEAGVILKGCEITRKFVPEIQIASEEDFHTEYLDAILSIRTVEGIDAAIQHINHYGSAHTDSIVTEHYSNAQQFLRAVDSSSVMVNASTRFADGYEYGLGAEIGISTDRFHARGPVGLLGLTNQKYIVLGDGHIRQ